MVFTEIDITKWPRAQVFYYFSKIAPTGYSLTADIDITDLQQKTRHRQIKFFPVYLWLATKCLNKQIEFKVAYENEKLGFYDTLTPLYASFHEDDKTFSFMWTEYSDSFEEFYAAYIENQRKYSANKGVLAQPHTPPPANAYTVSALPWISFKHFSVQTQSNKPYFFPSVESGKFYNAPDGKLLMPLSVTCHHATADGIHVSKFLDDLNEEMRLFL